MDQILIHPLQIAIPVCSVIITNCPLCDKSNQDQFYGACWPIDTKITTRIALQAVSRKKVSA